ncbi:MAG TPA: glycerophosphodiester phosphodiesterase [Gaiellaceae bacterium]
MIELRRSHGRPFLIGHRGARALAPENTLESLEVAARHGVDGVEVDVLRRPDGRLVLAHGPEIPAGAPSLREALALAAELGVFVQLDVKLRGAAPEIGRAVADAGIADRTFVSSFSLETLEEFAAAAPELPRSFTYPARGLAPAQRLVLPRRLAGWLRRAQAAGLTLKWTVLDHRVIDAGHVLGAAVLAWTVNDPARAKSLVEAGIDAIITDDPRIAPGGRSQT